MVKVDHVIITVLSGLIVPFVVALVVYFGKNVNFKPTASNENLNTKITITSIVAFSVFVIGVFCALIYNCMFFVSNSAYKATEDLGTAPWLFGVLLIQWVFTLRIHYTFTHSLSIFAYSSSTIYGMYFSLSMLWVLLISIFIIANLDAHLGDTVATLIFILAPLFLCLLEGIYVVLFILFFKKAMQMCQYKVDQHTIPKNKNEEMHELSDTNKELNYMTIENTRNDNIIEINSISAVVRYSILVFVGFTFSLITLCVAIMGSQVRGGQQNDTYDVRNILIPLDCFVNALCICLLFGFARSLYMNLCSCPDRYCKSYFVKEIMKTCGNDMNNSELRTKEQYQQLLFQGTVMT